MHRHRKAMKSALYRQLPTKFTHTASQEAPAFTKKKQLIGSTLAQSGYGTQSSVGSIYWGMDNGNHPEGADSAFLTPDGSQLTPDGVYLQQNTLA